MRALKQFGLHGLALAVLTAGILPACGKNNDISSEDNRSGANCPRGARYCDGRTLVICNESQTEWTELSCESEASCDAGLQFGVCGEDVDTDGVRLTCEFPLADCNTVAADGCETNLGSNAEHCGECGHDCSAPNAEASCRTGECRLECDDGFADCNGDEEDGCEVELETDESNCGACGRECDDANGTTACTNGLCTLVSCSAGYGDCDEDPDNGCETVTHTSVEHCGECGAACSNSHGTTGCDGGQCEPSCEAGYGNCDGDAANGCETDLNSTVEHCGACGRGCAGGDVAVCIAGACDVGCPAGTGDCDGDPDNGCEADVTEDLDNCGACGVQCENDNGGTECVDGICEPSCDEGYDDCDGDAANGCESYLQTDTAHCGACGRGCAAVNGDARCTSGNCAVTCDTDYANCDGDTGNGCEAFLPGDPENCGACGDACPDQGGTPSCNAGACALTCDATHGDCDANSANGCEADLATSPSHCGTCGALCDGANAEASCSDGRCELTCDFGYEDCDGDATNGCEAAIATDSEHCGRCGHSCLGGECSAGTCLPHDLAAGQLSPTRLRADETHLYWLSDASSADSSIRRVELGGGVAEDVLVAETICDFAVPSSLVWTTGAAGGLWQRAKDGGTMLALESGLDNPCIMDANDDWVIWEESAGIRQRGLSSSSTAETIDSGWAYDIAISGSFVYVANAALCRKPLLGGTLETHADSGTYNGVAVSSSALCGVDVAAGAVDCFEVASGNSVTTLYPDNLLEPVAIDSSYVYWATITGVYRGNVANGTTTQLAPAIEPGGLVVTDVGVYWTEPLTGLVRVIAKP